MYHRSHAGGNRVTQLFPIRFGKKMLMHTSRLVHHVHITDSPSSNFEYKIQAPNKIHKEYFFKSSFRPKKL